MTNLFLDQSIAQIHSDYVDETTDPVKVAKNCIKRVDELEGKYNVWVCFDRHKLLSQAHKVKNQMEDTGNIRPLEGIPVGIKDIMNTQDFSTQMGSPLWKDFTPGNDARVVYYIKNAGGVIPGKTVTAEFAVHTLGDTLNPHDITRTPGTSSSGSAVAIALGMVPVALGTQTAGSIVRPASFCGVYGCKPSFGLIPRTGILKTTDSLDTVGYFTTHFVDLERVFDVIRVHGHDYPISHSILNNTSRQNKQANKPWKVGFVKTHTWEYAPLYAKEAIKDFAERLSREQNIEVVEADIPPELKDSHIIHSTIYDKTLSYYFKEEFQKADLVSPILNDLIRHGNNITVSQYQQALGSQEKLSHLMDEYLQHFDIIFSLSTSGAAPKRDEMEKPDPSLMWTMTHLPVISAPIFKSPEGLPFGVQFAARRYNDRLLFKFCKYLLTLGLIPEGPNPRINM